MSVPTIYAFKQNEDGTVLEVISCCGYNSDKEGDRERAISEVQKEIQLRKIEELFIIDGKKLMVWPKIEIRG